MRAHLFPKLRCYFAEFLNQSSLERLGMLSPPTCVGLRYGHVFSSIAAFLGGMGSTSYEINLSSSHLGVKRRTDLPVLPAYMLKPGRPSPGLPTLPRHHFSQTLKTWYRNINLSSITYAFRPRLRYRLTLRRLALLRKP